MNKILDANCKLSTMVERFSVQSAQMDMVINILEKVCFIC